MTFTKPSNRGAQIIGHLRRRRRLDGNLPLRQVAKKVIGIAAVVMNHHRAISLLCQGLSELRNQDAVIM